MKAKKKKAKVYKKNEYERTRDYLKLNFKYPKYSIGFRWLLRARCRYKFDARPVWNAVLIVIEKIVIFDWIIGFLNDIFSVNFE
jgi:hypothetical protein